MPQEKTRILNLGTASAPSQNKLFLKTIGFIPLVEQINAEENCFADWTTPRLPLEDYRSLA
jgi:hypothetical protein